MEIYAIYNFRSYRAEFGKGYLDHLATWKQRDTIHYCLAEWEQYLEISSREVIGSYICIVTIAIE